jgi:hypothetical protein
LEQRWLGGNWRKGKDDRAAFVHWGKAAEVIAGRPNMAEKRLSSGEVVKTGISFGSALAITISWSLHKSLLWAVIHGFFSWFYVIYYALTR